MVAWAFAIQAGKYSFICQSGVKPNSMLHCMIYPKEWVISLNFMQKPFFVFCSLF